MRIVEHNPSSDILHIKLFLIHIISVFSMGNFSPSPKSLNFEGSFENIFFFLLNFQMAIESFRFFPFVS